MHVMPNNNVITDGRDVLRVRVNDCSVLNVCSRTYRDNSRVPSQNCPRPHGRIWTDHHTSNDDGIGVYVGGFMDLGDEVTEGVNRHESRLASISGAFDVGQEVN